MKIKKVTNKKIFKPAVIIAVVLLSLISYGVLAHLNNIWPFEKNRVSSNTDTNKVNLSPATDEQKESGINLSGKDSEKSIDDKKKTQTSPSPPSQSNDKQTVEVTITNYSLQNGSLHINAIASTLSVGSCKASVLKNDTVIATKTGSTFPQSSFVSCTDLSVPVDSSVKGSVVIMVEYTNNTQQGEVRIDASL